METSKEGIGSDNRMYVFCWSKGGRKALSEIDPYGCTGPTSFDDLCTFNEDNTTISKLLASHLDSSTLTSNGIGHWQKQHCGKLVLNCENCLSVFYFTVKLPI